MVLEDEEAKDHCHSFDLGSRYQNSLSHSFESYKKSSLLEGLKKPDTIWSLIEKEVKQSRIFSTNDIEAMSSIPSETYEDFVDSFREYCEKYSTNSPLDFEFKKESMESEDRLPQETGKSPVNYEYVIEMELLREQLTSISQTHSVFSGLHNQSILITDFCLVMMDEKTTLNDPCIFSFLCSHDVLDISIICLFLKLFQLFYVSMIPEADDPEDQSAKDLQSKKRVLSLMKTWYKIRRRDILTCPKTTNFWQAFFQVPETLSLLQVVTIESKVLAEWKNLFFLHQKGKADLASQSSPGKKSLPKSTESISTSPLVPSLEATTRVSLEDFCRLSSKSIADTMSFIDSSYIFNLSINDLKSNPSEWSTILPLYNKRYNSFMVWARVFILKQSKPANRLRVIKKLIEVMSFLSNSKYCNLESISIIHSVLTSDVITRLSKTWKYQDYKAKLSPYSLMVKEWKEKIIYKKPGVTVVPPFHKMQQDLSIMCNHRRKFKGKERKLVVFSWFQDYYNLISRFSIVQKDAQSLSFSLKEYKKHPLHGLFHSQMEEGVFTDQLTKSIPKEINFLNQYSSAERGFEDFLVRFSERVEPKEN